VDKAHTLHDYAADPEKWTIERAQLLPPPGVTAVDGADRELQEQYYGGVMENALSLRATAARRASLCLDLRRR
jgi:hypothetical protein